MGKDEKLLLLYSSFEDVTTFCGFHPITRRRSVFKTVGGDRKKDAQVLNWGPLQYFREGGSTTYCDLEEAARQRRDQVNIDPERANGLIILPFRENSFDSNPREIAGSFLVSGSFCHVPYDEKLWRLEWGLLDRKDRILEGRK